MYFIHNDLVPIYDKTSGVRTWRLELLYDCHFNQILNFLSDEVGYTRGANSVWSGQN